MSIFWSTQGQPDKIRSLMAVLDRHSPIEKTELARLLIPPAFRGDQYVNNPEQISLFTQTLDVAKSINWIESGDAITAIENPSLEWPEFTDALYQTMLVSENDNQRLFKFYAAWVLITLIDKNFKSVEMSTSDLLSEIQNITGENFNSTQYSAWKIWATYLGMGLNTYYESKNNNVFLPNVTDRMAREVKQLEGTLGGGEIPADEFISRLTQRMPYLDGGKLFMDIAYQKHFSFDEKTLSPIFSQALLTLHEDEILELIFRGDDFERYTMTGVPVFFGLDFVSVKLKGGFEA